MVSRWVKRKLGAFLAKGRERLQSTSFYLQLHLSLFRSTSWNCGLFYLLWKDIPWWLVLLMPLSLSLSHAVAPHGPLPSSGSLTMVLHWQTCWPLAQGPPASESFPWHTEAWKCQLRPTFCLSQQCCFHSSVALIQLPLGRWALGLHAFYYAGGSSSAVSIVNMGPACEQPSPKVRVRKRSVSPFDLFPLQMI